MAVHYRFTASKTLNVMGSITIRRSKTGEESLQILSPLKSKA